jgi:hypothetical protein
VLDAFDAETCAMLAQELESYAETVEWDGLASLVLVEAERTRRGVTSCERRAYISSLTVSATELGAKVRGHWHVGQAPR